MISNKVIKMVYRSILLAISVIVAVVGCGPVGRLVKSAEPYRTEDYHSAFERWTREARIYRGFDVELIVSVTFKSSDYIPLVREINDTSFPIVLIRYGKGYLLHAGMHLESTQSIEYKLLIKAIELLIKSRFRIL